MKKRGKTIRGGGGGKAWWRGGLVGEGTAEEGQEMRQAASDSNSLARPGEGYGEGSRYPQARGGEKGGGGRWGYWPVEGMASVLNVGRGAARGELGFSATTGS